MIFWYKILTYIFYPFAKFYLIFRILKKKEHSSRYKEKLSKIDQPRGNGFLVWIHVASVGEAMSVLPLIDRYIKELNVEKILITSITLSSGRILEKKSNTEKKLIHQFLPLDIDPLAKKFLEHWKPNMCIFIDSEVWPNLILNIDKKKIPLFLINARITKKSFDRWKLFLNFSKNIFEKFNLCLVANKESENYLKVLGAKNIKNYGNLKFSNIINKQTKKLDNNLLNKIEKRKIWCAASTHPSEEILCVNSHLQIKKKINNILTIIIPRHIERVEKIKNELKIFNLKIILSSDIDQMDDKTDILLVNSYGETLKYFNISKYVFLGKSLVKSLIKDGGQNPIEAARLGCKVFHGPYVSNFVETYEYLEKLGVSKKINNFEELSASITEELKVEKPKNYDAGKKIDNYGQDIMNNIIMELKKHINY